MTVDLGPEAIILSGACGIEEVESLVTHLERWPDLPIDVAAATTLHTAIWQALMVFRPNIIGSPMSSFMADRALPALKAYISEQHGN